MSDPKTISFYDAKAGDYAKMVENVSDPSLDRFIAALPNGATVLDLGCGPGAAARVMADAGLAVTATDASAEMVRLAETVPGVTARQARFDEITEVAAYDGIWASFSLLHAPRAAFAGHLAAVKRALRPGGLLALGLKLGQGEKVDKLGRFYSYYGEDELNGLLSSAGLTVVDRRKFEARGMAGDLEPSMTVFAHG